MVSQKEVNKIKNALARKPKPTRARSRPLPEKLIPILKEILDEGESGWPGRAFRVDVTVNGVTENRYCPVIPSLFRVMLEIPLRMGQIRRLDSGEGDVRHFNAERMEWQENTGPLAGYWADLAGKPRDGFPTRGYAIEIDDEIKAVTGIWVNTNKTGEPWAMPWFVPAVHKILWDLRRWQETNNPISTPIGPEIYLDHPHKYSDATKAEMPLIFPLSRMAPNRHWPMEGRTVTASEIDHGWCKFLLETQTRWNDRHPGSVVTLVDIHPKTRQPYRPRYNIHGLRVRGLTNLRRGGMPLDLLSKFIAGHATLGMTVFYTEPHPSEVAEQVDQANSRSIAQRKFIDDLKMMEIDEARRRSVSISPLAVPAAIESASQFQFCNVAIGVCPYDGSRCSDGGELLRRSEGDGPSKSVYGPVEPRNCVMCRHFISGPPWLHELSAYGTKLCERRQYLALEEERINVAAQEYEVAFKSGTIGSAEFENRWDELGADIQQVKNEQEMLENAIFNVEILCNSSIKLLDKYPDNNDILLVANCRSSIEYEEISKFEQSFRITSAFRLHKILGEERVARAYHDYLSIILFNSGLISPQLHTKIGRVHYERAMDQYGMLLRSRASDGQIEELAAGTLMLRDIGIEEQVRRLLDVDLSGPLALPGTQQQAIAHTGAVT